MKPHFYSDFISSYSREYFTKVGPEIDTHFLDELYHYIILNPDACVNVYGEFLESTIHATIIFNYLKDFYLSVNQNNEYLVLCKLQDKKKLDSLSKNLLDNQYLAKRAMREMYETHTLN